MSESRFCPFWKKLEQFRIGKCHNRKVSELESVRIRKCDNLKVSELESVSQFINYLDTGQMMLGDPL